MVLIREYVAVLPFTCSEYQVAQRWLDSNKPNAGKVLERQKCVMTDGEDGLYRKVLCSNDSRTPGFIRTIAPAGSLDMYEESWTCLSHQKCVLTNGYLKDKMTIKITTKYRPDTGNSENVHNLPFSKQKNIEREVIDIANVIDTASSGGDRVKAMDPATFVSAKTGRGKLGRNWVSETLASNGGKQVDGSEYGTTPLMCCYIMVEVEVKIFGLQSKLEKNIQTQTKRLLTENFRQMLFSIDTWYGVKATDFDESTSELDEVKEGNNNGTTVQKLSC